MRIVAFVATLVLAAAGSVHAQEMSAGTRVKVWSKSALLRETTVTIDSVAAGILFSSRPHLRLPVTDIGRIEYSIPRSRNEGIRNGAKLGAFTGAAIGVLVGITTKRDTENAGAVMALSAPVGALSGALLGAGLGAIVPGKHWRCVVGAPCNRRP